MDIVAESKSFASGAVTGLVEEPFEAIRQIAHHIGLSKQDASSQKWKNSEPNDSIAFQAGKTAGKIAEFWVINRAVGAVSGIGKLNAFSNASGEALKMGIAGGINGMLTPVNDQNFAVEKFAGVVSESASFATFGAVAGKAGEYGVLGRPGLRKLWQDATINGTAGALSGAVGADLNSLLTTGNLAPMDKLGTTMLQNAVMGAGFAALDHSLPRSKVNITPDANGIKGSAYATEDWVANIYNPSHGELKSPILTWLAEKNLVPKPANYEELRKSAWQEKGAIDLNLADWSPQQRPAVIEALRRMAHPELGKDSNIDAYLSRITTSDTIGKVEAYREFEKPRFEARQELQRLISESPDFKGVSTDRLLGDQSLNARLELSENAALKESKDRLIKLQRNSFGGTEVAELNKDLLNKMNGVAHDVGIPNLKSVSAQASDSSLRIGDSLYLGLGRNPELNATSIEHSYHEFTHHTQGMLSGKETLAYYAKTPFYVAAKKLGLIDEIPMLQSPKNRQEYMHKYIGLDQEKEAWATGLLTRIRAVAAGISNHQD